MDKLLEFGAQMLPKLVALLCTNLKGKTERLQRKIRVLKTRKDDIICPPGKKLKIEVKNWMNNVEDTVKYFVSLEQRVQQSSRFYQVFERLKLDEELERMTEEVTELDDQGEFRRGVFEDESIDRLLLIQPNGQSFRQNSDEILTSIRDAKVMSVGIYGMGGVGKTTLAKHVHDELLKESTFSSHVYWVTVSQDFSIYELQSDIAQVLKLDIKDEEDEGKRAAKLSQEFRKMEKFVLILDDVWNQFDAEKAGIPFKRDGCKLVITSRSKEVCQGMDCHQKIIKVKTLSEEEALNLFFKKLNRDELSVEVKEICKKMVSRCDGLPLALITMAGSMRGVTDIREWIYALEELKESCLGRADMEDEVFPILRYSYDRLRGPRLKFCLLYCSLYPEDSCISREELIENLISEELLEKRLRWQAVYQGHEILNQLERACLLESDSNGDLMMHDLIREMAIRITKDNPRYMVKAGLQLEELPEEREWTENLDKVSLMGNKIWKISPGTSPKCPSLSTLILRENLLLSIPDCFFTHMCGLRTLDLRETRIRCLPNSISDLEKLNALLLTNCWKLVSVPSLEKLKELRHLDLAETCIEEVPQGMETLTNLKSLSLLCEKLEMIPTRTLRRLSRLQKLMLPDHLDVPIEEIEALTQLEVFRGRLNSIHDLNRLNNSRKIGEESNFCNILISSHKKIDEQADHFSPWKYLCFGEDSLMESSLDTDKNMLPRYIEILSFSRSGLSGCLLDEFPVRNYARDLKKCRIEEEKIECIMKLEDEQQSSTRVPFQSLEMLKLAHLPNLIGLFKWEAVAPLPPGTFSCLRRLWICHCCKIKKLFPQSLVCNFHNLQELIVENCVQMEEIIEDDNNEGADITLPMLKKLNLKRLPQLKSICKGKMICDSIQIISLEQIENIKNLPLNLPLLHGQLSPPPSLKSIGVWNEGWWESLEWADHNAKNVLEPFVVTVLSLKVSLADRVTHKIVRRLLRDHTEILELSEKGWEY